MRACAAANVFLLRSGACLAWGSLWCAQARADGCARALRDCWDKCPYSRLSFARFDEGAKSTHIQVGEAASPSSRFSPVALARLPPAPSRSSSSPPPVS